MSLEQLGDYLSKKYDELATGSDIPNYENEPSAYLRAIKKEIVSCEKSYSPRELQVIRKRAGEVYRSIGDRKEKEAAFSDYLSVLGISRILLDQSKEREIDLDGLVSGEGIPSLSWFKELNEELCDREKDFSLSELKRIEGKLKDAYLTTRETVYRGDKKKSLSLLSHYGSVLGRCKVLEERARVGRFKEMLRTILSEEEKKELTGLMDYFRAIDRKLNACNSLSELREIRKKIGSVDYWMRKERADKETKALHKILMRSYGLERQLMTRNYKVVLSGLLDREEREDLVEVSDYLSKVREKIDACVSPLNLREIREELKFAYERVVKEDRTGRKELLCLYNWALGKSYVLEERIKEIRGRGDEIIFIDRTADNGTALLFKKNLALGKELSYLGDDLNYFEAMKVKMDVCGENYSLEELEESREKISNAYHSIKNRKGRRAVYSDYRSALGKNQILLEKARAEKEKEINLEDLLGEEQTAPWNFIRRIKGELEERESCPLQRLGEIKRKIRIAYDAGIDTVYGEKRNEFIKLCQEVLRRFRILEEPARIEFYEEELGTLFVDEGEDLLRVSNYFERIEDKLNACDSLQELEKIEKRLEIVCGFAEGLVSVEESGNLSYLYNSASTKRSILEGQIGSVRGGPIIFAGEKANKRIVYLDEKEIVDMDPPSLPDPVKYLEAIRIKLDICGRAYSSKDLEETRNEIKKAYHAAKKGITDDGERKALFSLFRGIWGRCLNLEGSAKAIEGKDLAGILVDGEKDTCEKLWQAKVWFRVQNAVMDDSIQSTVFLRESYDQIFKFRERAEENHEFDAEELRVYHSLQDEIGVLREDLEKGLSYSRQLVIDMPKEMITVTEKRNGTFLLGLEEILAEMGEQYLSMEKDWEGDKLRSCEGYPFSSFSGDALLEVIRNSTESQEPIVAKLVKFISFSNKEDLLIHGEKAKERIDRFMGENYIPFGELEILEGILSEVVLS